MVTARSDRPLPTGDLDEAYYRTLHRHLFGGIYAWVGDYRIIRIAKGDSMFCYPEYIAAETEHLFAWLESRNFLADLSIDDFAGDAAHFLATLNAIHPFREGNGRNQLSFMAVLAARAEHPLKLARLDPQDFLDAMIDSFQGDKTSLAHQIAGLVAR